MTYTQATTQLPPDAAWICSFGNPGVGGFVEMYRTPGGRRFEIGNGAYDAVEPI
jgi:hypothetical protein